MTTTLDILFRTLGPLHVTSPERARVDFSGNRVRENRGFPCSMTQEQRIPLTALQGDQSEFVAKVPVVPANTIRGRLRRLSATVIIEHLSSKGEKLSLPAWNGLQSGSIFGHPDSVLPTVSEMIADRESVYLGAWGGSPRITPSSISIGTGYPVTDETLAVGMVPEETKIAAVSWPFTEVVFTRRVDDTIQIFTPQTMSEIVEFDSAYTDWMQLFGPAAKEALAGSKGTGKETSTGKIKGIMGFSARQVVLPNITFHAFAECRGQQKHLGILLESLRRWTEEPWIGGCRRLGMGRLAMNVLYKGEPVFERSESAVEISAKHPELVAAHKKAIKDVQNLSADDIESLFKSHEKSRHALEAKLKGKMLDAFRRLYG